MIEDDKNAAPLEVVPGEGRLLALEQEAVEKKIEVENERENEKTRDDEKKDSKGGLKDYFVMTPHPSAAALPLMSLVFGGFGTKFNDFAEGNSSPDSFRASIDHYTLWFIYLFVGRLVVVYVSNVCVSIAAIRTTRAIRMAFLESTLRKEIWYFDQETNGSISSQVTTNGNRINQGIAEKLVIVVQALSLFFSSFIVALAVQWKLALITMSIIPAIFTVSGICISLDAGREASIVRLYSRAGVLAQEAFSSIKTVHAFWAHEKIVDKYDEYLEEAHKIGNKRAPIWGIALSTEFFFTLAGSALAFWEGARLYLDGDIASVGKVLTVVMSVTVGATAVSSVAPQLQSITAAASAATELFSVLDKESLSDPFSAEGIQPENCKGDIQIRDLCFAYPARPSAQVLHNLDLSIPAGKTTALVGASGCGKSTLVGLLERWYQIGSGQILLDGIPLSNYNLKWLRSSIRLVQQEPVLFRGSIFQNVAKGFVGTQVELSYEKKLQLVQEACRQSNAHDFIMDLPQGYETEVGERASMLSGGQRQRIAIARSIISDPKILLLDEATSALDSHSEGMVQDALNKVSANKTTLIIAHKLATVKAADNIVVMSYGRVVEQGSHSELLARDSHYAALVRAQDLGENKDQNDSSEDHGDIDLDQKIPLERTGTSGSQFVKTEAEIEHLSLGTVGYSLLRCVILMLYESKEVYPWFIPATIASFIGGGVYPAQALLFSRLIHVFTLQGDEARNQANFFALMFFVVALASFFAYFTLGWSCNVICQTITHRYRREMIDRILHLDQDFFDRPENSSGALTSKLTSVPDTLQGLLSVNLFLIVITYVNLIASVVLAIAYGWKLGLVVIFSGLPLLMGSGYFRIHMDQKFEAQTGERFSDSAAIATEAVTSIKTVASLTLEGQMCREYAEILDKIVVSSHRSLLLSMIGYALSQSLEFPVMALGFWYGSRLLASGEYTVTQFYIIFVAVIFGGQAAGQFFGYSTTITKAKPAANYIFWLRTLKASIGEDDTNRDIGPASDGPLGIEDLEFRYKQRDASRVLRGISMQIKAGSYAACVGPSGCGKSTLISLLERFYDPISGRITLNEQDVTSMSPRLYRNHMSLVQQEPTLYQVSIRENVALGLQHEPSDAEVEEACRQANALEFISSLPEGLATPCGSKGLQFSGGQRQRIAIARALIRKPRLLLLDEATSALDTQSERIVQQTLDEAASTRTTIAVAHRLSTIRHADAIFVFANGIIAEMGTHEELLRLRGRYYEICLSQSLDQA